jgi:hypothetical protein
MLEKNISEWIGQSIDHTNHVMVLKDYGPICFCILKVLLKKMIIFFSLLQINPFLVFLDHFDVLISKMIFKK